VILWVRLNTNTDPLNTFAVTILHPLQKQNWYGCHAAQILIWRLVGVSFTAVVCVVSPPGADFSHSNMCVHKALQKLKENVDLEHQCGYITMLNANNRHRRRPSEGNECRGKTHSFFVADVCMLETRHRVELVTMSLPRRPLTLIVQIGLSPQSSLIILFAA